jgi:hypothetical protein
LKIKLAQDQRGKLKLTERSAARNKAGMLYIINYLIVDWLWHIKLIELSTNHQH